jgi:hypothetical protein
MTKKEFFEQAKRGLVGGIFWSIGVTIGFVIVTLILAFIATNLITLPLIGNALAGVVRATLEALGTPVPGN